MSANWKLLYLVPLVFGVIVLIAVLFASSSPKLESVIPTIEPFRRPSLTNPMVERPNMVDRLDFFDSPAKFDEGSLDHVSISLEGPSRLILADWRENTFPRIGTWISPQMQTEFGFTEFIPSWNASVPANAGVRFHARVHDRVTGKWSPWLYVGQWGRTPSTDESDRLVSCDLGCVVKITILSSSTMAIPG